MCEEVSEAEWTEEVVTATVPEGVSEAEWTEEVGTAAVPEGVSEAEWTEEVGKAAVSAQCLKGSRRLKGSLGMELAEGIGG